MKRLICGIACVVLACVVLGGCAYTNPNAKNRILYQPGFPGDVIGTVRCIEDNELGVVIYYRVGGMYGGTTALGSFVKDRVGKLKVDTEHTIEMADPK